MLFCLFPFVCFTSCCFVLFKIIWLFIELFFSFLIYLFFKYIFILCFFLLIYGIIYLFTLVFNQSIIFIFFIKLIFSTWSCRGNIFRNVFGKCHGKKSKFYDFLKLNLVCVKFDQKRILGRHA